MSMLLNCLAVGAGGFVGAVCRYLLGLAPAGTLPTPPCFPLTTFAINVVGSFLIGVVVALFAKNSGLSPQLLLFLKVGVCGGFTTFSTFSLESFQLIEQGHVGMALTYMVLSTVVCVVAAAAGLYIAR